MTVLIPIQCNIDVLHLNLILAFLFLTLQGLLAHIVDSLFEIFNHLAVLLLAEDVVLKLGAFDFFKSA